MVKECETEKKQNIILNRELIKAGRWNAKVPATIAQQHVYEESKNNEKNYDMKQTTNDTTRTCWRGASFADFSIFLESIRDVSPRFLEEGEDMKGWCDGYSGLMNG